VKPARFDYVAPRTLDEALAAIDDDARPLAGGQSLMPILNFRLARPARIVDLNGVPELGMLRRAGGVLRIGAMVRQKTIERSAVVAEGWPLLRQAVQLVGHPQTRSRGTVGGSVAHADPTGELPVALTTLGARFHVRSRSGARTLGAGELFAGPLTTTLEPDELLVEIEVPALPEGAGTAFVEHAPTHNDWALAGAGVVHAPGRHAAIGLLGAGTTPLRATEAEQALVGGASAREVAALAAGLVDDGHRRALTAELVRQAIERAGA
jgi:CO/xanthine dehydrogenase FAD-binding subunit